MHPLMHMCMLVTGFCLIVYDKDKFYAINENVPKGTQAWKFATDGKYLYMFLILTAHLSSIVLHYASQLLVHCGYKSMGALLLVLKVISYLYTVMEV